MAKFYQYFISFWPTQDFRTKNLFWPNGAGQKKPLKLTKPQESEGNFLFIDNKTSLTKKETHTNPYSNPIYNGLPMLLTELKQFDLINLN